MTANLHAGVFVKIDDTIPLDITCLNRLVESNYGRKDSKDFRYTVKKSPIPSSWNLTGLSIYGGPFWYLFGNELGTDILKR
jgi:hypothetical protein